MPKAQMKTKNREGIDDKPFVTKKKLNKFTRGSGAKIKNIHSKVLKNRIQRDENQFKDAATKAALTEYLLTEESGFLEAEGLEKTCKFKQSDLKKHLDIRSAQNIFDLKLPDLGPYKIDYTRNGSQLLIGGRKGHVASFNWRTGKLACEIQLRETVRDVKWLHNETMFAAAQKQYVYIYDKTGMELHCLKQQFEVNRLDFLPYHFLLVSVDKLGILRYQDTSTGQMVTQIRSKMGPCDTVAQNPRNAVIHMGHTRGSVTLWTPTMPTPVVKMLCHKGPVTGIAVDNEGRYMATTGLDRKMHIWDIRNYKELYSYFTPMPATSLSFSQKGLLSIGYGNYVDVWKGVFDEKQKMPYMSHHQPGNAVVDVMFCPFEDVLGVGHANGFSSLVIPGSGEPNYDALEANPFQTKKQRQESEVHSLLDKIQPDMISLRPSFIGKTATDTPVRYQRQKREL